jgi:hypothetical protein
MNIFKLWLYKTGNAKHENKGSSWSRSRSLCSCFSTHQVNGEQFGCGTLTDPGSIPTQTWNLHIFSLIFLLGSHASFAPDAVADRVASL